MSDFLVCSKCRRKSYQPDQDFSKDRTRPTGYSLWCKSCVQDYLWVYNRRPFVKMARTDRESTPEFREHRRNLYMQTRERHIARQREARQTRIGKLRQYRAQCKYRMKKYRRDHDRNVFYYERYLWADEEITRLLKEKAQPILDDDDDT